MIDALRTLKEKAIDAANDSNSDTDRAYIQKEINGLVKQMDDNALTTYNGMTLVDGTKENTIPEPGSVPR